MAPDVRTGHVIAGYRIGPLLGAGAMGSVYLAEDTRTGERVALKLLAPELAPDERFRRRFLRETELARTLEHPHVVRTLEAGEEDGTLFLAMAYIDGEDLRKLLRREGTLDARRAIDLAGEVADALDAAHEAGLVHRDVKPGNVLIRDGPDGEHAYVCDFGLARHVSSVSSLTSERSFVGTIDYVSPEQIEGGTIDGRADVYSLACLLFECLAGTAPFERESELSVVFAHLNDPPPPLTDFRPDLSPAFHAVFVTALAKTPDGRYSTCTEFVDAARAALAGEVVAPRRRPRKALAAVAAVVLAGFAAAVALVATHGSGHAGSGRALRLSPNALNLIGARTHSVSASIPVGAKLPVADTWWDLAFTMHAVWALLGTKQRLVRIDLATHRRTADVRLPWSPGTLTTGGGAVWVTQDNGPAVWRLDAATGKVTRRLSLQGGQSEGDVAYGAGSLWLGSVPGVVRVDPASGHILHRFPIEGISGGMQIVFANGAVFAARPGNGQVVKIDPGANAITHRTPLHGWVSDLAVGGGRVWVSIVPDGVVYELSPDDLSVRGTARVGSDPERISFGDGQLWSADPKTNSVARVAQVSGGTDTFHATATPAVAVYHAGDVWVGAAQSLPALAPIAGQVLRIAGSGAVPDPVQGSFWNEQALYATCANLLNYPDASGAAGARLRPEIAAGPPVVSNDGRTYTFRVRSGFHFSPPSNEAVTAATFRHTIERELLNRQGETFASDIVGAGAFRAGATAHVAGITARGDLLRITLERPAGDFPTRISMPQFCPVPLSTPLRGAVHRPIPSAGPYYVASSEGGRTVLERNPNYHGNRPRRSARIVYDDTAGEQQSVLLADRAATDLVATSIAGDLLQPGGVIDRRARTSPALARRYHVYQAPIVDYFVFNTRRPLFRDARLRRAVNEAVDRSALAAAFGDTPADGIVPPAVFGYPAGRIWPLHPDVAAARRLAGRRTRHAVLFICGDSRERTLADIVRRNLAAIRLSVTVSEAGECSPRASEGADLAIVNGFPYAASEERDPAQVVDNTLRHAVFGEPLPPGPWRSRSFVREVERARVLQGSHRTEASRRLTDELTREAPVAVFGSWVWSEYFSPRIGCKVFQTHYGAADLGSLCKTT